MEQATLSKLWSALSALALAIGAITVAQTQGVAIFGDPIEERPVVAAIFAAFFVAVLMTASCFVAAVYANKNRAAPRIARIPIFWLSETDDGPFDRSSLEVRLYLVVTLVLFVIAPCVAIVHLEKKVAKYGRIQNQLESLSANVEVRPYEAFPWIGARWNDPVLQTTEAHGKAANWRLRACNGEPPEKGKDDPCRGIDWHRYGTPLTLLAVTLLAAAALLAFAVLLLRPAKPTEPP
jgi:hypothetical protein